MARKTVFQALKQSWIYMLTGIVVALFCSSWSGAFDAFVEHLHPTGFWGGVGKTILEQIAFFLEHLAIGFFVSSIAVFFYEWGSHAKHALDLSHQLEVLLREQGENRVTLGLEAMLPDSDCETLRTQHDTFIAALKHLNHAANRGRQADIHFMSLFVGHAAQYGSQLKTLRDHLANPGEQVDRPFYLDFSKVDYADSILKGWMDLLGDNDEYVTMSNPRTWSALRGRRFAEAGRTAVTNGAHMRRIFIMEREDDKHSPDDIRNLIKHYQFAADRRQQGKGSYRIQIARPDVFEPRQIKPENQHYGIFTGRFATPAGPRQGDERLSVAFKVKGAEVENFELVAVPKGGELETNFDEIWNSLETSAAGPIIGLDRRPTDAGASRFLDAVMSREIKLLVEEDHIRQLKKQRNQRPKAHESHEGKNERSTDQDTTGKAPEKDRSISLEIVSTLKSWRNQYDLPDFYTAIRDLEVRHLFILDGTPDTKQLTEITQKQRQQVAYWKVYTYSEKELNDRVRHWLEPHWRVVDADRKPLHHCVFTLNCTNDLASFFLTDTDSPVVASDYAKHFADIWVKAAPLNVKGHP